MLNKKKILVILFCFLGISSPFLLCKTELAKANNTENKTQKLTFNLAFKPPGQSQPNYTVGAAVRNGSVKLCQQDKTERIRSLTALISSSEQAVTLKERPTFFVYIPETSAQQAFLVIKDRNEDYYYEKSFSLPSSPGIVSINLPNDAPPLKIGKEYTWYVSVACGKTAEPNAPFVAGKISRESKPELTSKLRELSSSEQVFLYEQELIWYDALATVAELKKAQPENATVKTIWQELLSSVGMEDISTQPLNKVQID